jgi:tRNA pseudouridine55 synthase
MLQYKPFDFLSGEILLVDKPLHWTSFDVVNKVRNHIRRFLHLRKIKVGHAGTLDPLATGLLIICTGKKTREIDKYQAQTKTYTGTIELGRETPSYDLETDTSETHPVSHLTEEDLYRVAATFVGKQEQMPPSFSAKKIDGKRAYSYARNKEKVVMNSKEVFIHDFEVVNIRWPYADFRVVCSKGTYIRSLAHDFGKALQNGACLVALRRTHIGDFAVSEAWNLDALLDEITGQKPPQTIDGIIFDFNRTLYDPEKEKLMDGARKLLRYLKNRELKMALLSKATDQSRRQFISELGLDEFFDEVMVVTGEKTPHHFHSLQQALGIDARRCLIIGDRVKSEISAANSLGMQTCWLRRGKFKKEIPGNTLEQPGRIINNIQEIYHFL